MGALFLLFPSSLHPPPSHPLLLSTPMTKDGLDGAIERYLARTFGERVDFALERALPALERDGLIVAAPGGGLTAAPLAAASKALAARWAASLDPAADDGASALAVLTAGPRAAGAVLGGAAGAVAGAAGAVFGAVGKGLTTAVGGAPAPGSAKPKKRLFGGSKKDE